MRIYHKINFMALSVMLFVGLSISFAGFSAITQLTYQFYKEVMAREVENVVNTLDGAHAVLKENRLEKVETYLNQIKSDVVTDLKDYHFRNTGVLIIVASNGKVIKHSSLSEGQPVDIPFFPNLLNQRIGNMELDYNGQKRFFSFQFFPEWEWLILLSITSNEILSARTKFLTMVSIILALSVCAGSVMVIWLAKRVSDPIRQLADATTDVSKGKWDTSLPVHKGKDEISLLTKAFRQMADSLGRMYGDLEDNIRKIARSQEALQDSEKRYRSVFDNTGTGMALVEKDMRLSMVNAGFERMTGFPAEEIEGKMKFTRFIAREDQGRLIAYHQNRRKDDIQVPSDFECSIIHRDGKTKKVAVKVGIIPDTTTSVASFLDITEREKAELALKKSEANVRLLLDSTGEGILGLDNDGSCTFANPASVRMLGYESYKELIGQDLHILFHQPENGAKDISGSGCRFCQMARSGVPDRTDNHVLWTKDGDRLPVAYSSQPTVRGREIIGSVVTFKDISEKIQMNAEKQHLEKQLMQSHKMEAIGTLAGGIAHDFNNILSGIYGYSALVQSNIHNAEKLKKHVAGIQSGTRRASELVQQILMFSRQTEYEKYPFKVYLEVKEALKLLRSSIPTTIEIKEHLDSKSMIMADPTKIHQVLMNLCTNGYHAMADKGGTLTVVLRDVHVTEPLLFFNKPGPAGEYLEIMVRDTGHGMDEVLIEKIFDPYFTTKKAGEGTGLGLAIVQAIVDEHDGFLRVSSEVGQFTSFHLYFPIIHDQNGEQTESEELYQTLSGDETIMLVDDEEAIRLAFSEILHDFGYQVDTFENGMDALEAFKARPDRYHLVLTDMTMPGITGLELVETMNTIKNKMPSILCSGFNNLINEQALIKANISQYLTKPIFKEDLVMCVRDVLDGKAVLNKQES